MVKFDEVVIEYLNDKLQTYTSDIKGLFSILTKDCNGVGFLLPIDVYNSLLQHCAFPKEVTDHTNNYVFKFGNYLICEGSDFIPENDADEVTSERISHAATIYVLKNQLQESRFTNKCNSEYIERLKADFEYEKSKLTAKMLCRSWGIFK